MRISADIIKEEESQNIIKLRVDGAQNAVNTFGEIQSGRGISLICPFPALEVDVPVRFGKGGDGAMESGSLHRISVEEDPETGLPRLRLSIRKDEREAQVEEEQIAAVLDFAEGDEPAWVDCGELPLPEEYLARSTTRRRYKLAGRAAWLIAFALFVAGGYVLERTGWIDVRSIRTRIAGFSLDETLATPRVEKNLPLVEPAIPEEIAEVATANAKGGVTTAKEAESVASPVSTVVEAAEIVPVSSMAKVVELKAEPKPEALVVTTAPEQKAEPTKEATPPKTESAAPDSVDNQNIDTIFLPTRWPVEYVTGYRVRNPNGVVIDVPGGLVRREGWLEMATLHPMIRSVKVIQRETGARFIIYVHGELPGFMTNPLAEGVSLRLYRAAGANDASEVALLDQ